jgi:hypothetical protein
LSTLLLAALLRADSDAAVSPADCFKLVGQVPEVAWWGQFVPRTNRVDGLFLAGVSERSALAVVDILRCTWAVHAGLYRHRIGGLPGRHFITGGSVSIFACDVQSEAETEWNEYYDSVHFPNVVSQETYVDGARFDLVGAICSECGGAVRRHLVVYELQAGMPLDALDPATMSPVARAEYEDWLRRGQPHIVNAIAFKADPNIAG